MSNTINQNVLRLRNEVGGDSERKVGMQVKNLHRLKKKLETV